MRMVIKIVSMSLAITISGSALVQAADLTSGSGAVIGANGEVLTNAHVVENCTKITVRSSSAASTAFLIARDEKNDLAVVRSKLPLSSVVAFREGGPVRAGDAVVALGYPLSGLLATTANLSVGNVSALAGLGDDLRYLQISAPVQPGNSGGPLLDGSGHLVGIVTAKLNAMRIARFTGDVPQNVNFALKAEVARAKALPTRPRDLSSNYPRLMWETLHGRSPSTSNANRLVLDPRHHRTDHRRRRNLARLSRQARRRLFRRRKAVRLRVAISRNCRAASGLS